jgi:hypothetical protein
MLLATWGSRAMVTGAGHIFTPFFYSLFPNAMRWMAASTRIPEQALLTLAATSPASPASAACVKPSQNP